MTTGQAMTIPTRLFDPALPVKIIDRRLPHWSQAGAITFITWRTADSIPADVLRTWLAQRDAFLREHQIDPRLPTWRLAIERLNPKAWTVFHREHSSRWHDHLDACHGECPLRDPRASRIVADVLHHFDGQRYELIDFVTMPNHVHVQAAFPDEQSMLAQCDSWKHFTAREINRLLRRKGRFWQQDGYDHLVRSEDEWRALRQYLGQNPVLANLKPSEYIHYAKAM